ncbi:MAG: DUF3788 domain-containing protein [Oscillospiraceae bacterium]|nr:DUF3788 domain-containing protein [Oscillospiraceae bacterium]
MTWNELFPKIHQPTMDDIAEYAGSFASVWQNLLAYFETAYKCKPKMTHSCCSAMPGWNLKFQKGNATFGTWYPLEDAFGVMFIWSYALDAEMLLLLPTLTPQMAAHVEKASDFMKNGRWMMFRADSADVVEDYKRMCAVKKAPIAV